MTARNAKAALERLREGNRRFVSGEGTARRSGPTAIIQDPSVQQEPFAVILGCSDSRVPVEIVFDQGLGDLFVIRVAGNIVAPSQVGSIEFAADLFRTRLVVVMGHENCGAINATVDELIAPNPEHSRAQKSIVDRIKPVVEPLLRTHGQKKTAKLVDLAVRANVLASVSALRHGSEVLEQLIAQDGLLVVGAEYSITTGVVDFFEVSSGTRTGP